MLTTDPMFFTGYETVFEKKAFGGELELSEVQAFFNECDLYPSKEEIDEAMDVTLHGDDGFIFILISCYSFFFKAVLFKIVKSSKG